jgi:hypothetical protein
MARRDAPHQAWRSRRHATADATLCHMQTCRPSWLSWPSWHSHLSHWRLSAVPLALIVYVTVVGRRGLYRHTSTDEQGVPLFSRSALASLRWSCCHGRRRSRMESDKHKFASIETGIGHFAILRRLCSMGSDRHLLLQKLA